MRQTRLQNRLSLIVSFPQYFRARTKRPTFLFSIFQCFKCFVFRNFPTGNFASKRTKHSIKVPSTDFSSLFLRKTLLFGIRVSFTVQSTCRGTAFLHGTFLPPNAAQQKISELTICEVEQPRNGCHGNIVS